MLSVDPDTVPAGSDAVDAVLAAAGDARAFERLYRTHAARVYSLARRMAGASAMAYTRNLGSRTSRSQSPTRFTPSAVSASAAPGKAASHQAM